MASLRLDATEMSNLNDALKALEGKFGQEYTFAPESSEFSCSCSGPARSCVWH